MISESYLVFEYRQSFVEYLQSFVRWDCRIEAFDVQFEEDLSGIRRETGTVTKEESMLVTWM